MGTTRINGWQLAALGGLALALQSCVTSPLDGSRASNRDGNFFFDGMASQPSANVRVQAYNQQRWAWSDKTTARAAATVYPGSTSNGGQPLYYWRAGTQQVPAKAWVDRSPFNLMPGQEGTGEDAWMRVVEDASQIGTLRTFNQRGSECLNAQLAAGKSYSDAGAACTTGTSLRLWRPSSLIVLPVHVHVLASSSGALPNVNLTQANFQAWLDPVGPDTANTAALVPPDQLFAQAGIQFRLASFIVHRTSNNLNTLLLNDAEIEGSRNASGCGASRIKTLHEQVGAAPGIHVYLGGRIGQTLCPGGAGDCWEGTYGLTCGPGCLGAPSTPPNFVLIDARSLGTTSFPRDVLAHELGHFLGLKHTDDSLSCGRPLLSVNYGETYVNWPNLMWPGGVASADLPKTELTEGQRNRVRTVGCGWARSWNLRSGACG